MVQAIVILIPHIDHVSRKTTRKVGGLTCSALLEKELLPLCKIDQFWEFIERDEVVAQFRNVHNTYVQAPSVW